MLIFFKARIPPRSFAKWLYPDLFGDLDPEQVHQEYIDRFQNVDYDLKEHGAFVYPPMS